jgi:hypothetical protein
MKEKKQVETHCLACHKWLDQPKHGRKKLYCNANCRQKGHHRRHGGHDRAWHQRERERRRIEALPFVERVTDPDKDIPLHILSNGHRLYQCGGCGETYTAKRRVGKRYRQFCSNACENKAKYHWRRLYDAYEKASQQGRRLPGVRARFDEGKLSPLCPVCDRPFPPNFGKPGRPKKYCDAVCRKKAYEQRWKTKHGTARRHRNRLCAECGRSLTDRPHWAAHQALLLRRMPDQIR